MWWKRFFHHRRQFSAIAQCLPDSDPYARDGAFTLAYSNANAHR
jgi:hypothetical protein